MERDYEKLNTAFAIKRATINTILGIVIWFLMYLFFNNIIPNIVDFNNRYFLFFFIFVILYVLVKNIFYYKNLLEHLNRSAFISELKRKGKNEKIDKNKPEEDFYFFYMFYAERLDVAKVKIDILKSFVPIPVIVLLLGFLLNSDTNIFVNYISSILKNIKNMELDELSFKEGTLLAILISIFYYFYEFLKTWLYYKTTIKAYYIYKYEYDILDKKISKKGD